MGATGILVQKRHKNRVVGRALVLAVDYCTVTVSSDSSRGISFVIFSNLFIGLLPVPSPDKLSTLSSKQSLQCHSGSSPVTQQPPICTRPGHVSDQAVVENGIAPDDARNVPPNIVRLCTLQDDLHTVCFCTVNNLRTLSYDGRITTFAFHLGGHVDRRQDQALPQASWHVRRGAC